MNAIDTNVLIYAADTIELQKQPVAAKLCNALAQTNDTILLWQVLLEFARWLTTKQHEGVLSSTEIRALLTTARQSFPLRMPAPTCLDLALDLAEQHTLSHWDSMLVAACLEVGVTTLYTEDMGTPRTIETLELVNPFLPSA